MMPTRFKEFEGLTTMLVSASGSVLVVVTTLPTAYAFPAKTAALPRFIGVVGGATTRCGASWTSSSPFSTAAGLTKGRQLHRRSAVSDTRSAHNMSARNIVEWRIDTPVLRIVRTKITD